MDNFRAYSGFYYSRCIISEWSLQLNRMFDLSGIKNMKKLTRFVIAFLLALLLLLLITWVVISGSIFYFIIGVVATLALAGLTLGIYAMLYITY
jgi:hypothetical protein